MKGLEEATIEVECVTFFFFLLRPQPNRILLTKSLGVKLLFGYEAEQFVCFECHFPPIFRILCLFFLLCFIFCRECDGFLESGGHQEVRLPKMNMLE